MTTGCLALHILAIVFGISGGEFLALLLVIVIVVGPQRLPEYTSKLTQLVRQLRLFIDNAKEQIAEEVGPELGDLSLKDLDPRNYDPRKIVRDALGEDLDAIRRDLTSPIESVLSTVKKNSDDAAASISQDAQSRSNKSLSQMIEDKAEETRRANAQTVDPAPSETPEQGTSDPQLEDSDVTHAELDAAAEADDAGLGQPRADDATQYESRSNKPVADDAVLGEPGADDATQYESRSNTPEADDAGLGESGADGAGQEGLESDGAAQDEPVPESAAQGGLGTDDAGQEGQEGQEATEDGEQPRSEGRDDDLETDSSRRSFLSEAVEAVTDVANDVSSMVEIPSTLAAATDSSARDPRPVSPREIVRAANAAARTRREAATAVVDA